MTKIRPVAVFDCVVFGATGDLTLRKLLPALYYRFHDGQMPAELTHHRRRPIPIVRRRLPATRRQDPCTAPPESRSGCLKSISQFLAQLHYVSIDATAPDADWSRFGPVLDDTRVRVFYLATSPDLYGPICHALGANGMINEQSRVVLEKPIGHDAAISPRNHR